MNPFTDDLDYTIKANMSGEDIIADTGTFENITVTEDATIKDLLATNLEKSLDGTGFNLTIGMIKLGNSAGGILDSPANTYSRVGDAGTTSHSLAANDDLFVSGKLEVDGAVYFDSIAYLYSSLVMMDDQAVLFGSGQDAGFVYGTVQTPDSLMVELSADSNSIVFIEKTDIATDFAHALQTNPTIFVQSNDATSITEWISMAYNGALDDGQIGVGKDDLTLAAVDDVQLQGDVTMDSNVYVGSPTNYELFSVSSNGTHVILESSQSLPINLLTYSPNGTAANCFVNDTLSWICEAR